MSTDPIAALRAADPLPADVARRLELPDADLVAAIVAEPRVRTRPALVRRRPPRLVLAAVVVGLVVAGVALAPAFRGGAGVAPRTAWAAELVRFAEASPLVLLDAPGWRVDYADEHSPREGEMRFIHGSAPPEDPARLVFSDGRPTPEVIAHLRRTAELSWRPGPLSTWTKSRASEAVGTSTAPVLGTTAHVYEYRQGGALAKLANFRLVIALWRYRGRVMEFRWTAPDVATFRARLADLRRVGTDTWLSAMPESVVKAADRPSAVAQIVRGVPLPPGFDVATIPDTHLTKDRYHLGAQVTGAVACAWIKRWSDARRRGDTATVRQVVAAMATAKDWPILHEMVRQGAFPQFVREFGAAMRTGSWHGRPLEPDAEEGLSCAERGVPLR